MEQGWLSARGNLTTAGVISDFENRYRLMVEFFREVAVSDADEL
jgi:hypothetical protein